MKIFFERTESEDKSIIIFKPYSMYVLLAALALLTAVTFVPSLAPYEYLADALIPIAALIVVGRIVVMFKVNREIQQAVGENNVDISGGKLSAKNPLTFTINKKPIAEAKDEKDEQSD